MSTYKDYKSLVNPIPEVTLAWNLYGEGVSNIGKNDQAEAFPVEEPGDNELLVRIDAVGLCFSDVKVINQGSAHPKLYNRDLSVEPTRLGHEATVTIVKAGKNLAADYKTGERYAVQPDIYQNGKSTAYGYTVPGGLTQYQIIGPEVLETDTGACLLRVSDQMGFAESALLEPWGCVWASYTQRRRLEPKQDGIMWIVGEPGDNGEYQFTKGLDAPKTIVLTNVPQSIAQLVNALSGTDVVVRDDVDFSNVKALSDELTQGVGFDDIVLIQTTSAKKVTEVAKHIARRGTMTLAANRPLDGLVDADVGRLHYDYIAFFGTQESDISTAYGEARNRCDLSNEGSAVFVGAGGPMGQMHVQRAIEKENGPKLVVVTDINDQRLSEIESRFAPLTKANGCTLLTYNPVGNDTSLHDFVMQHTDQKGADDVVVCVPNGDIMADSATFMNENGMLVLFAGVPNGTLAPVDLSNVYLNNAQFTGTSGLTIDDQTVVMDNAVAGNIAPAVCVAAIGGMKVARDGIEAMIASEYPGKILIFPQLLDLPLMGLDELAEKLPNVAKALAPGNIWTVAAEEALFAEFLEVK
ncbi:zinc-binding dehydrogenase [Reinekea forsetii]|nr:zinc-binding dehydrogenase [Reinekea forsetii]